MWSESCTGGEGRSTVRSMPSDRVIEAGEKWGRSLRTANLAAVLLLGFDLPDSPFSKAFVASEICTLFNHARHMSSRSPPQFSAALCTMRPQPPICDFHISQALCVERPLSYILSLPRRLQSWPSGNMSILPCWRLDGRHTVPSRSLWCFCDSTPTTICSAR